MFTTFNITTLIFTALTGFGLVFHDTKADYAATSVLNSMATSAAHSVVPVTGYVSNHGATLRSSDHTHTETVSMSKALKNIANLEPRLQTRINEEKKYVGPKKLLFDTSSF